MPTSPGELDTAHPGRRADRPRRAQADRGRPGARPESTSTRSTSRSRVPHPPDRRAAPPRRGRLTSVLVDGLEEIAGGRLRDAQRPRRGRRLDRTRRRLARGRRSTAGCPAARPGHEFLGPLRRRGPQHPRRRPPRRARSSATVRRSGRGPRRRCARPGAPRACHRAPSQHRPDRPRGDHGRRLAAGRRGRASRSAVHYLEDASAADPTGDLDADARTTHGRRTFD